MRINKEQYDVLVAKLDWLDNKISASARADMMFEKAIEQGLDKLLQSHAALEKQQKEMFQNIHDRIELYSGFPEALLLRQRHLDIIEAKLDALPSQVFAEFQKRVVPSDAWLAKEPAKRAKR